ncbi:MAG: S41 family peptidase [Anaerolineae bacterium]
MKGKLWLVLVPILVLLLLSTGVLGGIVLDRQVLPAFAQTTKQTSDSPDFQLMSEAWQIIQRHYVDRSALQEPKLTYGAISGLVDSLGDTGHTSFMTPEMVKQENNFTQGSFEGIGAEVEKKDDHIVIVAPIDDSPAQKAGLKPGDIIMKVNGEDVTGQSLDQVIGKILGPAGTQVTLTIQSPSSGDTRDLTITRARILMRNVTWQKIPGTTLADIRIAGFSSGVGDDLKKALAAIKQDGSYTGIVLDLRNNPGGLLSESVAVTSQFVNSGNVLLEKDAEGRITPVPVDTSQSATVLPMVIVINNGTASASEIVSGALQDANRAKLVGQTTFGTGTVLNQFGLSDGSALLLATQEWLTPNGRVIWHKGIVPDLPVTLTSTAIPLSPTVLNGMTADQLRGSDDAQLLKAIDQLDPNFAASDSTPSGMTPN